MCGALRHTLDPTAAAITVKLVELIWVLYKEGAAQYVEIPLDSLPSLVDILPSFPFGIE
jgi:hypothetical protein